MYCSRQHNKTDHIEKQCINSLVHIRVNQWWNSHLVTLQSNLDLEFNVKWKICLYMNSENKEFRLDCCFISYLLFSPSIFYIHQLKTTKITKNYRLQTTITLNGDSQGEERPKVTGSSPWMPVTIQLQIWFKKTKIK